MSSGNPANFVRTIKLRSVVDAEYKPSYNRLSFMIDPDDFSSDLSQSYLALRMYLCHANGTPFTKADFVTLDAQNIFISFGQNDQTYSPLCLIKTARLFAQANYGTPLEECNFVNTLTQTLYNLMNDYESVGSSSLTNNNSVVFGHPESASAMFANLLEDSVGAGAQRPIEVHLKLSDLFGVFKSKNFYLNDPAIMGFRIDLELEDLKPLFRSQVVSQLVPFSATLLPPFDDATPGLIATLADTPITSLTAQNNTGQMTCIAGPDSLPILPDNTSEQIVKTNTVVQNYQFEHPFFPGGVTRTNVITLLATWGAPILESMGLVDGASLRLNFKLVATAGLTNLRQSEIFTRLDTIDSIATVDGVTVITLTEYYVPATAGQTQWTTDLDSFEVVDSFVLSSVTAGSYATLFSSGQITVTETGVGDLQTAGLIGTVVGLVAGDSVPVCPAKFNLHCQTAGIDSIGPTFIDVIPWFDTWIAPDVPTSRQLVSNRNLAMPIQGTTTQLLSAVVAPNGTSLILTFKKLGMVNNNSLAPAILHSEFVPAGIPVPFFNGSGLEGGGVLSVAYDFWISDFNDIATGYRPAEEVYTYLIDKAELVLVQSAKQSGLAMGRVFTTNRVEVTTIQSAVPIYNYQFVVPEANVYNIMLLTPQYNTSLTPAGLVDHSQSLISWQRGVTQYRWSVNQIDQTNRDIEVGTNTSFYPSSLYLESLMDVLGNGNEGLMSLAGPLTVPHSDTPVVAFPLRIYKSSDSVQYIFHPEGFVAQITLIADTAHDGYVVPGNIYLWKQMLRTF